MRSSVVVVAAVMLSAGMAGCSAIGSSEITITARNDSQEPMVVGVISGIGPDASPHGGSQTIPPGGEGEVTLEVPGGAWTVTVNGARLMESSDAGDRRGELPVTVILSPPDASPGGPHWQSPLGWSANSP